MPARLTVIVYILICLEVGILLIILPWTAYWDSNIFLYSITAHATWLADIIQSGYVRGLVTSLGLVNIGAGIWEAYRFRDSVRAFSAWESPANEKPDQKTGNPAVSAPANLPDHRSESVSRDSARHGE
jgi:hypothetical protein